MDAAPAPPPDADATLAADALPAPFADALATVAEGGRMLLTRDGKPAAFLVSVGEMEDWEAFEDAHWTREAKEAIAEWEAAGRPLGIKHEDLLARYDIDPAAD